MFVFALRSVFFFESVTCLTGVAARALLALWRLGEVPPPQLDTLEVFLSLVLAVPRNCLMLPPTPLLPLLLVPLLEVLLLFSLFFCAAGDEEEEELAEEAETEAEATRVGMTRSRRVPNSQSAHP